MTRTSHSSTETQRGPTAEQRLIDAARAQLASQPPPLSPDDLSTLAPVPSSHPHRRPLPASDAFPGYKILREIHGGGQGVVYQALQESTGQKVALKVIHEGPFADPRNRARLERGVRILAELNHPNIVSIIDSGESNGSMFYVMDYIPGQSLDEWLDGRRRSSLQPSATRYRSRWPWSSRASASGKSRRQQQTDIEDLVRLFIKICDATHAAHLRGVIHRDLKPGNIRIDDRHEPHLLDFDLAKILGGDVFDDGPAFAKTVTGEFLGTLRWASPEQIERAPAKIDTRTDVYSLGVVLYEALTGLTPYPMLGTRREIEDHILNTDPPPPSRHRASLDPDLDAIVLKCLSKSRERRYHSAGPIADDLRSFLAGAPISARRDSSWYLLRKLARRHKLVTTTLFCMTATLIGATLTSLHFYRGERQAKDEQKAVADQRQADLLRATQSAVSAQSAIHRQVLGWFLLAWNLDQQQWAKTIRDRTPASSPEYQAMQFLLDPSQPSEAFLARLSAGDTPMGDYVVGERCLKQGRLEPARRAFADCAAKSPPGAWYRAPAEARLTVLGEPSGN